MTAFHISSDVSKSIVFSALVAGLALLGGCSSSSGGGGSNNLPDPDDTTPADFSFTEQTGVALDTLIESNAITVSDIDSDADISIDEHGEYAVDGGSFTDSDGTVTDGQEVVVRVRSPDMPGAVAETTLTIGGVSATFSVTTQNDPTGYYTGTAEIVDQDGETRVLGSEEGEQVHGLLTDERFLIFSTYDTNGYGIRSLTYEVTNINLTGTDYTADLTIYDDGEASQQLTVEGTVTEGSGLTMTMDGERAGSGTVKLTYAQSNSESAELSRIVNDSENPDWYGDLNEEPGSYGFIVESSGAITDIGSSPSNIFADCEIGGTVEIIETTALYKAEIELSNCEFESNGQYSGLITVLAQGAGDILVLVFSDGTLAGAGVYD